uniref:Cathepsin propeptide inhibitor domain-containing protein n=1 Tax=Scleropages formosus TaxID=113540 RepID=A0A8C9VMU3_SCLFO
SLSERSLVSVSEKSYSSPEEEAKRKKMWLETRTRVIEHNKRADAGEESYWMAVNHFADRVHSKGCCHDEK